MIHFIEQDNGDDGWRPIHRDTNGTTLGFATEHQAIRHAGYLNAVFNAQRKQIHDAYNAKHPGRYIVWNTYQVFSVHSVRAA